jgi:hypothetical protein
MLHMMSLVVRFGTGDLMMAVKMRIYEGPRKVFFGMIRRTSVPLRV